MALPDVTQKLKEALRTLRSGVAQPKFSMRIHENRIVGEELPSTVFAANEGYFQINLAEMFIRNQREYWRTFLPFVLILGEFVFNGAERAVPVFAGSELLKSIENYVEGEAVEYRNTSMIGPTPYCGGKLALFVGLFRTKNEDLAGHLLDLVNEIGKIFPVSELSRYLNLLAPLGHGINNILGIKDVEMRIGVRNEFDQVGPNLLRPGYLVYINSVENKLRSTELWVLNGQLWIGDDKPESRFRSDDYCLVRLDFRSEREFSTLSFAKYWPEIKGLVWDNQQAQAEALFLQLGRELAISPDVTPSHRFNLIRVLKANLEREFETWNQVRTPMRTTGSPPTRGGTWTLGGLAAIQQTLSELPETGKYAKARESLRGISAGWKQMTEALRPGREIPLTDEVVARQLQALGNLDPNVGDATDLMDALTYVALKKKN